MQTINTEKNYQYELKTLSNFTFNYGGIYTVFQYESLFKCIYFSKLERKRNREGGGWSKLVHFFNFFLIFLASKWPHFKKGPMGHHKLVFLESSPIMVMKPKSKKKQTICHCHIKMS